MKRWFYLISLTLFAFSCSKNDSTETKEQAEGPFQPEKVLFIGNSHTYFNGGVPSHLAEFLKDFEFSYAPFIDSSTKGGYTLNEHLQDENTLTKVAQTDWDVVVLQENTSIAAYEGEEALNAIKKWHFRLNDIDNKSSGVYLYMTWEYEYDPNSYETIKDVYEQAGTEVSSIVVPVAVAFQNIKNSEEMEIDLYQEDGVHTTLEGTFLTAAMFALSIYDIDPTESDYTAGLPLETADYLKRKAKEVYMRYTSQQTSLVE